MTLLKDMKTHTSLKAGGRWDPEEKLWRVPFGAIRGNAELEERILND